MSYDLNEVIKGFNEARKNATSKDQVAKIELLREYYTNPAFKEAFEREIERLIKFLSSKGGK